MDGSRSLTLWESRFADGSIVTFLNVSTIDPEREVLTRLEMFDEADRDAALARYEGFSTPIRPHNAPPFTNEAFRIGRQVDELFVRGEWAASEELVRPDCIGHNAMRFRTWDVFGPDQFIGAWRGLYETEGEPTGSECTLLAIRGETLCLEENVYEFGDASIATLQLTRTVDGKIAEVWFFDRADLHDAHDELDRQWVRAGGPSGFTEEWAAWRRGQVEGNSAVIAELVSPEFQAFDQRRLGLPPMDRQEYVVTSVGPRPGTDVVMQQIYELGPNAGLWRSRITSPGGSVWEHIAASRFDDDWEARTAYFFDVEDYHSARCRYEELVADAPAPAPADESHPTNPALVIAQRAHTLFGAADL
ncbi:MAG: hypothetical protein KDA28_09165, partial [Phycisphaerales bacterium]|nr:hypothetical protein [Phycisphaerales bacterium]